MRQDGWDRNGLVRRARTPPAPGSSGSQPRRDGQSAAPTMGGAEEGGAGVAPSGFVKIRVRPGLTGERPITPSIGRSLSRAALIRRFSRLTGDVALSGARDLVAGFLLRDDVKNTGSYTP